MLARGNVRRPPATTCLRVARGGEPGQPITLRSAPGEHASLKGIVYIVHGSDDIQLVGLHVVGDGSMNAIKIFTQCCLDS